VISQLQQNSLGDAPSVDENQKDRNIGATENNLNSKQPDQNVTRNQSVLTNMSPLPHSGRTEADLRLSPLSEGVARLPGVPPAQRVSTSPNEVGRDDQCLARRKERGVTKDREDPWEEKRLRHTRFELKKLLDNLERTQELLWEDFLKPLVGVRYTDKGYCLKYWDEDGEEKYFYGDYPVSFLKFFVKHGIPNLEKIRDTHKRRCFQQLVRFAHVDLF
jgi:hypothetical protein